MSAENFSVCRVAGLGNKTDIDEADLLDYLGEDPETKSIFLYLEGIKDPKRFMRCRFEGNPQKTDIPSYGRGL